MREKYQKTDEPVEKRRWQILWKIALGWTVKNTAIAVGVSYQYAHKVLAQYNQEGVSGLKNKRKNRKTHKRGKDPLRNGNLAELFGRIMYSCYSHLISVARSLIGCERSPFMLSGLKIRQLYQHWQLQLNQKLDTTCLILSTLSPQLHLIFTEF
ncbi:helix-turn-helix domain containing protein [Spirulina sp. CS-785/01]|uniref:helix-turn-helix domain-containing protein n=1 Tax=Spirulina sp. CS-785/01 TaxID=3021716 RepID=UPI0023309C5E|nr:helix-turn-helix domain-containing protein [Spirulina sp. CS-785/01]MDB9311982.1 helix-turn-helix domain containing protein [Spirulina sp. CS-785/01]